MVASIPNSPFAIVRDGNPPRVLGIHNNELSQYLGPFTLRERSTSYYEFKCGRYSANKIMKVWINWTCEVCGTNITPQRRSSQDGKGSTVCNAHGLKYRKLKRKDFIRITEMMSVKRLVEPGDLKEDFPIPLISTFAQPPAPALSPAYAPAPVIPQTPVPPAYTQAPARAQAFVQAPAYAQAPVFTPPPAMAQTPVPPAYTQAPTRAPAFVQTLGYAQAPAFVPPPAMAQTPVPPAYTQAPACAPAFVQAPAYDQAPAFAPALAYAPTSVQTLAYVHPTAHEPTVAQAPAAAQAPAPAQAYNQSFASQETHSTDLFDFSAILNMTDAELQNLLVPDFKDIDL